MEKSSNKAVWWILGVVAILVVGGLAAYALANQPKQSSPETTNDISSKSDSDNKSTDSDGNTPTSSDQAAGVTIVFTDQGFEKTAYAVKKGQTVTVKNESDAQLQFSSDDHPTHTEDPELNLEVLEPGQSASFTPTTVGEHDFHDHLQSQFTGTLTVSE
ncbi:MAG TPA: cupredoxin domain-containing protein [Candidatus Saccharimonadales bacterium]